jgi:hypothetical protein
LEWKMLVHLIAIFDIYGHLVYFEAIQYILWLFGVF